MYTKYIPIFIYGERTLSVSFHAFHSYRSNIKISVHLIYAYTFLYGTSVSAAAFAKRNSSRSKNNNNTYLTPYKQCAWLWFQYCFTLQLSSKLLGNNNHITSIFTQTHKNITVYYECEAPQRVYSGFLLLHI